MITGYYIPRGFFFFALEKLVGMLKTTREVARVLYVAATIPAVWAMDLEVVKYECRVSFHFHSNE